MAQEPHNSLEEDQGQSYYGQPLPDDPSSADYAYGQPVYGQPVYGGPVFGEPVYGEPVYGEPLYGQPVYGEPIYGEPIYGEPVYGVPIYEQPVDGEPPYGEPVFGEPIYGQPIYGYPLEGSDDVPVYPAPVDQPVYGIPLGAQGVIPPVAQQSTVPMGIPLNQGDVASYAQSQLVNPEMVEDEMLEDQVPEGEGEKPEDETFEGEMSATEIDAPPTADQESLQSDAGQAHDEVSFKEDATNDFDDEPKRDEKPEGPFEEESENSPHDESQDKSAEEVQIETGESGRDENSSFEPGATSNVSEPEAQADAGEMVASEEDLASANQDESKHKAEPEFDPESDQQGEPVSKKRAKHKAEPEAQQEEGLRSEDESANDSASESLDDAEAPEQSESDQSSGDVNEEESNLDLSQDANSDPKQASTSDAEKGVSSELVQDITSNQVPESASDEGVDEQLVDLRQGKSSKRKPRRKSKLNPGTEPGLMSKLKPKHQKAAPSAQDYDAEQYFDEASSFVTASYNGNLPIIHIQEPRKSRAWIVGLVAVLCTFALLLFGMISCSQVFSGGAGSSAPSANSIAVIDIDGTIQYDGSANSPEGLAKLLQYAEKEDAIKAVVLRVNSGGGIATAGEEMAMLVRNFKKPIVVSSASMNASAAYEISSQADYIFVSKTTEIGSIGTVFELTDISGLMELLGIDVEIISSSDSKDSTYGYRALTREERDYYQRMVDQINEVFIENVAEGRGMSIESVRELANGLVYTGIDAVQNGLADEIGSREDAIAYAAKRAGLDRYTMYELGFSNGDFSILEYLL